MLKDLFFILLFLLSPAYSVFSQEPPPPVQLPTPIEVKIPESIIRGRIVYEDNGKPVRRGEISLLTAESLTNLIPKAITNDSGEFELKGVRAGNYYPLINVPGVLNPNDYEGFFSAGEQRDVSAAKLDTFFKRIVTDGVNEAQVVILAKRAGAISGRATFSDGDPAPGIRVQALRKAADLFEGPRSTGVADLLNAKTDDRGFYRFSGLPPGEYIIRFQERADHTAVGESYDYDRDWKSELKSYFPGVATAVEAKVLEIAAGQQQEGVDIVISDRKLFQISGAVLSKKDKKPLKGVGVSLQRTDSEDPVGYGNRTRLYVLTDEQGKWALKDLPGGVYRAEIGPQSGHNYEDQAEDKKEKKEPKYGRVIQDIKVVDTSPQAIVTELPYESTISGTIVSASGKPLPQDINVIAIKDESSAFALTYNYNDAKKMDFRINDAWPGSNTILVYLLNNPDFYVLSIKYGSSDILRSPLTVKEGEETKGLEIVLSDKPGIIKGKVRAGEGVFDFPRVGIGPAGMSETHSNNRFYGAVPNENGEFVSRVAPGEYFVFFYKNTYLSSAGPWDDWYKKQTAGAKKITIKEGETINITLDLPKK